MNVDDNGGWGVQISLTVGVKIPQWIAEYPGVTAEHCEKNGTRYALLVIPNGHAMFKGGVVKVTVRPDNNEYHVAFWEPTDVLEIRDKNGRLLKDNHRLCYKCFMNTKDYRPMPCGQGRYNVHFRCQRCGHRWSQWNIEWTFHDTHRISGS